MRKFAAFSFVLGMAFLMCVLSNVIDSVEPAAADEQKPAGPAPVESDMHEFMEYVFQPTFKRLQQQMANEVKSRAGWSQVKSEALILAEGGNLTMLRGGNDSPNWNNYCKLVRDHGGDLYRAAKSRNYETARKHYVAMVEQCNACHKEFAGGEHMLTP